MNTSLSRQILCRSLGLLRNLLGHWTKSFMENFERSKATRQKFEGFKSLSLVLFKSRTSSIISKIKFALFQQKFYMKYTNILFQCTSPITSTFSGWHRRTWTSPWVFLTRTLFQRSLHITLNFNVWLGGRVEAFFGGNFSQWRNHSCPKVKRVWTSHSIKFFSVTTSGKTQQSSLWSSHKLQFLP